MLLSASIRNFILIEKLDLDFDKGLTVITGETGAGKSIILDAIFFCLNLKKFSNIIKVGADYTSVSLVLDLTPEVVKILEEHNIPYEDTITIKRYQNLSKQKKLFINDEIVTSKVVETIAEILFDYQAQNTHNFLGNSSKHLSIVDAFGDFSSLKAQVLSLYKEISEIKVLIQELESKGSENELDYLKFVSNELTHANLKDNEEEKLINKKLELQKYQKTFSIAHEAYSMSQDISSKIIQLQRALSKANEVKEIADSYILIDQALINIEEASSIVRGLQNMDFDQEEFKNIEERIFFLKDLSRKYNIPSYELKNFLININSKIEAIENKSEKLAVLQKDLKSRQEEYLSIAKELSQKRKNSSKILEKLISEELVHLKMAHTKFEAEILELPLEKANKDGINQVRFIASLNPGTPLLPIDSIASGGELSRLMLAVSSILFQKYRKEVLIFDEIDVGLGGQTADAVGRKLKSISEGSQVIAITHQPQVASKANHHLLVFKTQESGNTKVTVRSLNKEDRTLEIARMLSGSDINESAVNAAKELLIS